MNDSIDKVVMGTAGVHGFLLEDVWELKWPLASNWQLTSLASEVSHDNLF